MNSAIVLSLLCVLFCVFTVHYTSNAPRRTILYKYNNMKMFKEDGVFNYTSMVVREDLGLVFLGAREAIYALDMTDISNQKAGVYWPVTEEQNKLCKLKGKDAENECRNYIQTMQSVEDGRILVCGTNAYSPTCDYMAYSNGKLKLEGKQEEGKGKCPFNPFERHASTMIGNDLYSATSFNFLGTQPVFQRSSSMPLRTEFRRSWLNEPTFIHMDVINESLNSVNGDDDKVYMFFVEKAVEFEQSRDISVSRVARVCKGDVGGKRTLQSKWTTFLKARLDCPLVEPSLLPSVVQDVFLLEDKDDWRKSVFYAVFTSQSQFSDVTAVCSYRASDISDIFSGGRYKTPVQVDTEVKWVRYAGQEPIPRPGSCINNALRDLGMRSSEDLPDKTLQFVRERPLLDDVVLPLTGGPLILKRGSAFNRIVVDQIRALDGELHNVMFIGTDDGSIQKAVNYNGDMVIIEDMQLFETPQPIQILRLSSDTGQLYAGSQSGAVQVPVRDCGRYTSCVDCVLARDPYCGWDMSSRHCSAVASTPSASDLKSWIQSLKDADASMCPKPAVTLEAMTQTVTPGNNILLRCTLEDKNQQVHWNKDGEVLHPSDRHLMFTEGLLILNALTSDSGHYRCESVETVKGKQYPRTVVEYELLPPDQDNVLKGLQPVVATLSLLLMSLAAWHVCRGVCLNHGDQVNRFVPAGFIPQIPSRLLARGQLAINQSNNNNHVVITIEEDKDCAEDVVETGGQDDGESLPTMCNDTVIGQGEDIPHCDNNCNDMVIEIIE